MKGNSRDQIRLLAKTASPGSREQIRIVEGRPLREHYEAIGRRYRTDYTGHMRCKFIRVDRELLIGSCNWTTASRGNWEACAKVLLHSPDEMERFFDKIWLKARPMAEAEITEGCSPENSNAWGVRQAFGLFPWPPRAS